ncbi:energy transducer TonB [Thermodesulforhabdus norvegica]|uniref:Protein TonB n=1 Tax=Thermodesulforhabdus norvegica TaxID=39841 RepID=A0A1I4QXU8_9BACT|nr:energy transducer TonB [Thermodesulforhabdus norvegica]SFM44526.1 protein TonB [Thermodesulforhabdus norvegica]
MEVGKRHYIAGFLCTLCLFLLLSRMGKNDTFLFTTPNPIGIEYSPYGMDFQTIRSVVEPEEIIESEPPPQTKIPEEIFFMEPPPPMENVAASVVTPPDISLRKPRTRVVHARVVHTNPVKTSRTVPSAPSGNRARPGIPGGLKTYGVAEVDEPPRVLHSVKPVYPLRARRLMIEGEVVVRFVVGRDGSIEDIRIISANPEGYFEKSVIEALKKWRFLPGRYKGETVKTLVVLPVKFRLKE